MSRNYHKKTQRSRRKVQKLPDNAVQVDMGQGQVRFQMVLPLSELLGEMAEAIEGTACQAGLLMMKAMIDEEVEQLAGPRGEHHDGSPGYRWGKEEGRVVFLGRKVALERPRVRAQAGGELTLQRYQAFGRPPRMEKAVQEKMLRRVSTRDYEGALDDVCDGYGIDKSSVSRHWKAASTKRLQELLEQRLENLSLAVIMLDGKEFHDYTVIVALGIDMAGRKHVLGLWPGATENAQVCGELLDDLMARGLAPERQYLWVLDGAKALKKAVRSRFGGGSIIQRCRIHKQRNILAYLPPDYHRLLRLKLRVAWNMTDYAAARKELQKVHDWLATINIAAAQSLEEGLEETLTVNRLALPAELRRLFSSTNMIESGFSLTGDLCHNVKRWRDGNMAWRWAGTILLEAQKRFHRVMGYRALPLLINALEKYVATEHNVA